MRLFGKKRELPPLISDEELFPSVNFDSVMDWLVGLSDSEYLKVMKVADINRNANKDSHSILGKPVPVTSLIHDPKYDLQTMPPIHIDKDPAFILEEPKKPKAKKS